MMVGPTDKSRSKVLRLGFDRRLMLQFRGSTIISDAGLPVYRELDDALHLIDMAANLLADTRTGESGRHWLAGLLTNWFSGNWLGDQRVCRLGQPNAL